MDNPNTRFEGVLVPALVLELAAGRPVEPVWVNQLGGVTFAIDGGAEYVKYGPPHDEFDPDPEFARLRWVSAFVTAPRPIDHGIDAAGNRWLRTVGIPATSAVLAGWRERPDVVVPELGRALRHFHHVVPVADCRWAYSVEGRLAATSVVLPPVEDRPAMDAVVCHGDACNPNFLLDEAGRCVGYVDLGMLGVGDRWADLAPALLSLGWNYGQGWEPAFLEAYGIERDAAKQEFYTWVWNSI
ncbi:MAG: phosphotransferase [Propionicimonas sp.]